MIPEKTANYNNNSPSDNNENNSHTINILPQPEYICTTKEEKPLVSPECDIVGLDALSLQLALTHPEGGSEFWIKKDNKIPFQCLNHANGKFSIFSTEPRKDETGEYVREGTCKIWEPSEYLGDGYSYILKHPAQYFILPANQIGGIGSQHNQGSYCAYFEIDNKSFKEQWAKVNHFTEVTGIFPALIVFSAGKSLHVFFGFNSLVDADTYQRIKRKLICAFKSDSSIQNLSREMRLAGVERWKSNDETKKKELAGIQSVQFSRPEAKYSAAELELAIDTYLGLPEAIQGAGFTEFRWKKCSSIVNKINRNEATEDELYQILFKPEDELNPKPRKKDKGISREKTREFVTKITEKTDDSTVPSLRVFAGKEIREYLEAGLEQGHEGRNPTAFKIACILLGHQARLDELGIPHADDVLEIVQDFGAICEPPLPESEIQKLFDNALCRVTPSPCKDEYFLGRYRWWAKNNGVDVPGLPVEEDVPTVGYQIKDFQKLPVTIESPIDFCVFLTEKTKQVLLSRKDYEATYSRWDNNKETEKKLTGLVATLITTTKVLDQLGIPYFLLHFGLNHVIPLTTFPEILRETTKIHANESYEYENKRIQSKIDWAEKTCNTTFLGVEFFVERVKKVLEEDYETNSEKIKALDEYLKPIYAEKAKKTYEELTSLNLKEKYGDRVKVHFTKERYLTKELAPKAGDWGIHILPNPMGAGKTQFIKQVIARNPEAPVAAILPVRSLCRDAQAQYGLEFYEEPPVDDIFDPHRILRETQRLALCYNSLYKIAGKDTKNINFILDEFVTGIYHLMNGATVNKDGKRPECIAALETLLSNFKENKTNLFLADANANRATIDYLVELCGEDVPIHVYTTEWNPKPYDCTIYTGKEAKSKVDTELFKALSAGRHIAIASDNQTHGEDLHTQIKKDFPKMNGFRIDSSTSSTNLVKEFFMTPNETLARNKIDYLIYTPSVAAGTSMIISEEMAQHNPDTTEYLLAKSTWEDGTPYFKHHFVYNTHLATFEIQQMIGRPRHAIPRTIYLNENVELDGIDSPYPDVHLKHGLKNSAIAELLDEEVAKILDEDATLEDRLRKAADLIATNKIKSLDLIAKQSAIRAYQQRNRCECLKTQLEKDGHKVTVINTDETEIEDLTSEFSDAVAANKEERNNQKATDVVAVDVAYAKQEVLREVQKRSYKQQRQLEKLSFETQYPGLLNALGDKATDFYLKAVIQGKYAELAGYTHYWRLVNKKGVSKKEIINIIETMESIAQNNAGNIQDIKMTAPKLKIIEKLKVLDVFPLGKEISIHDEEIKKLIKDCTTDKNLATLTDLFNLKPLKKNQQCQFFRWFEKVLSFVGIDLKFERTEKQNGDKIRYYIPTLSINAFEIEELKNILDKALITRWAKGDQKPYAQTLFDLKSIGNYTYKKLTFREWVNDLAEDFLKLLNEEKTNKKTIEALLHKHQAYGTDLLDSLFSSDYQKLIELSSEYDSLSHPEALKGKHRAVADSTQKKESKNKKKETKTVEGQLDLLKDLTSVA